MASSGSVKGFFRQRKNITKPKPKSSSSSSKKSPHHPATFGADVAQPAALISHGSPDLKDGYDEHEDVLRQFDMNMAYGPCLGMSRLARWERAHSLGLDPPKDVEGLLRSGKVRLDCLWDGRV